MAADPLLEVRGVTKSYGRRRVLEGVDLTLERGQMLGLVGENGAGKSTLLRILVGLVPPGAGEITRRGTLGYCPQEPLVFDALTVGEHFRYFATAYGVRDYSSTKDHLLDRLRFRDYEGALVGEVSGGTRQKLNLSMALLCSPDILVLDEPYSGFDWETYLCFWEMCSELRAAGKAILVVSHFVYDREKFDAVHELSNGVLRCA